MPFENIRHQSHLRKGRFSEEGRAYSLTKCASQGISLIQDPSVTKALIETLFWMGRQNVFSLGAFVVMPDHYHAVIVLAGTKSLTQIMRSIGSHTAREANRIMGSSGQFWQRGYYDRAIRKTEDINAIFEYIHHNPVRRGLVQIADEWPYSSIALPYRERIRWHLFL
jgi:REP element-mobilizing transposase RayT